LKKTKEMKEELIPVYIIEFMSQEWITWTSISLVFISLPLIIAKYLNRDQKVLFTYIVSVILIIDLITEHYGYISAGNWSIEYNLPLQLCGISGLILIFLPFLKNKQKLFQFVYYAGIIGGIMAILTPQMNYFDGSLRYYLNFYVSHSLLICMPIFYYMHLDLKLPRLSWFRLWVNLNIILAIIMPLNFLINSNYLYLAQPPEVSNPLVIGEWPYYIMLWEVFILIVAYIVYIITKRRITL
jgi:hypothetical integral membrane protein (TIGR02206 family)